MQRLYFVVVVFLVSIKLSVRLLTKALGFDELAQSEASELKQLQFIASIYPQAFAERVWLFALLGFLFASGRVDNHHCEVGQLML